MIAARPGRRGTAPALAASVVLAAALAGCAHFVILNDPLSAAEHNDLGVAYEATGKLELAERQYRKALSRRPGYSQARVNLGNVLAARERWRDAEAQYRRALRDSTTNADAMNNLAVVLLRQRKRLDEARVLAERAVAAGGARDSIYRATLEEVRGGTR